MNLSTAEAVQALGAASCPPLATVHWWHLLTDSGALHPTSNGWRLEPPLGGPPDRAALRAALASGLISAVAVHHQALDAEEQLLPIDQRRVGLAGHGVVLPLLWQALVQGDQWPIEQLWQALCWGPCNLLGLAPEVLEPGGRRWLLFDPQARWSWPETGNGSLAANQPLAAGTAVRGLVRATGLLPSTDWQLS
jgi:dihydroorotase